MRSLWNRSCHISSYYGGLIGGRWGDAKSFEQRGAISPARGALRGDGQSCDQQQDASASLRCRRRELSEAGRGRSEIGRSTRRRVEQTVASTRPAISPAFVISKTSASPSEGKGQLIPNARNPLRCPAGNSPRSFPRWLKSLFRVCPAADAWRCACVRRFSYGGRPSAIDTNVFIHCKMRAAR